MPLNGNFFTEPTGEKNLKIGQYLAQTLIAYFLLDHPVRKACTYTSLKILSLLYIVSEIFTIKRSLKISLVTI